MKNKMMILILATVALAGTTSYASTGEEWDKSHLASTLDPNVQLVSGGSAEPTVCRECEIYRAQARLEKHTAATQKVAELAPKNDAAKAKDGQN